MQDNKAKSILINSGLLILSTFILMGAAFYNRFPITHFGDTALYIMYGFTKTHPGGTHSFFYGLFIRFASCNYTLWGVIFIQCLLLAHLITEMIYNFTPFKYKQSGSLNIIIVFLLGFCTSLLKHSGSVMPDIFTSMCFLSFALLFLGQKLSNLRRGGISLILLLSITLHSSHVFTLLSFLCVSLLIYYLYIKKQYNLPTKNIINVITVTSMSLLVIPIVHNKFTDEFYISKTGQTILLGRLAEVGILNDYLKSNCHDKKNSLCEYQDTFTDGWTFHWDMSKSPLYKNGGQFTAWENSKKEYTAIVLDIFKHPKYIIWFLYESVKGAFSQLMYFTYWADNKEMDWVVNEIGKNLPNDLQSYKNCMQVKGWFFYEFDQPIFGRTTLIYFYSSLIIVIIVLTNYAKTILNLQLSFLLWLFISYILINAVICAAFAGVYPRYQDRMIWLFPFIVILLSLNKIYNFDFKKVKSWFLS